MLEIGKTIELLTLFANGYISQPSPDLRNAAKMGSKALQLLGYEPGHRLSDTNLKLLLDAERRGK